MKRAMIVILVVAAAICASSAIAQTPQGPSAGRRLPGFGVACPATSLAPPQPMFVERADSLQLPAETKDKLKTTLMKADETLRPLRQKSIEASRLLREAMVADEFDEAKVKQLTTDATKAEQAIIDAELGVWREIRGILTADQLKAMRELIGSRGGMRRQGGPGPGPGPQPDAPVAPPPPPPAQ